MKKWIIVLLPLLLLACQEEKADVSADLAGYLISDYEGVSGLKKAKRFDNVSNLLEEGNVFNGKKEGTWLEYHITRQVGAIKKVTNYHQGQITGPVLEFDMNGRYVYRAFYKKGVLDGISTRFKYGKRIEEAYYVNGQYHGVYKRFYDNGERMQETHYKHGVKHGDEIIYKQNGGDALLNKYVNGVKQE